MDRINGGNGIMGFHVGPAFTTRSFPAPSAKWIVDNYPAAKDGYYWIDFDTIGPQFVYCIMDKNINGGGWMALTPTISPQINNISTSSTWIKNTDGRLNSGNPNLLIVDIVGADCSTESFYQLKSPSDYGINYTTTMLLMERISTIGQCSETNEFGTYPIAGYFDGPVYSGSYTGNGTCTWGDGKWAGPYPNTSVTGLKNYWILLSQGYDTNANPPIRYGTRCSSATSDLGQHYHMWFVK